MTRQRYLEDGHASPFSEWLRLLSAPLDSSRISNHNLDYVWHNYRESWLLLLEEKRFGGSGSFSQHDTHHALDQLLTVASGAVIQTARGSRAVEYRGYFLVRFSQSTPDDSAWVIVNGHTYEDAPSAIRSLLTVGVLPSGCRCHVVAP